MLFANLASANRSLQVGSAICLTRVIQNAPVVVLQTALPLIAAKILETMAAASCKAHTQLLESLISLILAVEGEFSQYAPQFLPLLLECMTNNDWQVRKMAIDVIYTMAAILRQALSPFKAEILEVLNHTRSDKIKPVREATQEAIQAVKDIPSAETGPNQGLPPRQENKRKGDVLGSKSQKHLRDLSPVQKQAAVSRGFERRQDTSASRLKESKAQVS